MKFNIFNNRLAYKRGPSERVEFKDVGMSQAESTNPLDQMSKNELRAVLKKAQTELLPKQRRLAQLWKKLAEAKKDLPGYENASKVRKNELDVFLASGTYTSEGQLEASEDEDRVEIHNHLLHEFESTRNSLDKCKLDIGVLERDLGKAEFDLKSHEVHMSELEKRLGMK